MVKKSDSVEWLDELVGTCGVFKVKDTVKNGAFVDCGLSKDLYVAYSEQLEPMKIGNSYVVYVYRDEKTGRVEGSSKLNKFLYDDAPDSIKEKDEVDIIVYSRTDLGYKVVVGKDTWGVIYRNEVFRDLKVGDKCKGYVKKRRADGKLDITLEKQGFSLSKDLSAQILDYVKAQGKSCTLSDKTPAEEIYRLFGVSKNKFKMSLGQLYKERKLLITDSGVRLV